MPYMDLAESMFKSSIRDREKEGSRIAAARAKVIADPAVTDRKLASRLKEELHPSVKVKPSAGPTQTDAVSASFQKRDPRAGLGRSVKRDFERLLTAGDGIDPDMAMEAAWAHNKGKIQEDTFNFIRKEESSIFGSTIGQNRSKTGRTAGYEEWLAGTQAFEAANPADGPDFIRDAPRNAAIGGGFVAAWHAGKHALKKAGVKTVMGRALTMAPHPVAKIAGAAVMAIPEFYAFEKTAEVISKTEWGQANQGSVKGFAAEMVGGMGTAVPLHMGIKAVKNMTKKSMVKDAAETGFLKDPTAANALNLKGAAADFVKAEFGAVKEMDVLSKRAMQMSNDKRYAVALREDRMEALNVASQTGREVAEMAGKDLSTAGKDLAKRGELVKGDGPGGQLYRRNMNQLENKGGARQLDDFIEAEFRVLSDDLRIAGAQRALPAPQQKMLPAPVAKAVAETVPPPNPHVPPAPRVAISKAEKKILQGKNIRELDDELKILMELPQKPPFIQKKIATLEQTIKDREKFIRDSVDELDNIEMALAYTKKGDPMDIAVTKALKDQKHKDAVHRYEDKLMSKKIQVLGDDTVDMVAKAAVKEPEVLAKRVEHMNKVVAPAKKLREDTTKAVQAAEAAAPVVKKGKRRIVVDTTKADGTKIDRSAVPAKPLEQMTPGEINQAAKDFIKANGDKSPLSKIPKKQLGVLVASAGAAGATLLAPSEADASILSSVWNFGSQAVKKSGAALAEHRAAVYAQLEAMNMTAGKIVDPYTLPRKMEGLSLKPSVGSVGDTKRMPLRADLIASPHYQGQWHYKQGQNPAIEIASRLTAGHNDTELGRQVVQNILREVKGYKNSDWIDVAKATKPISGEYTTLVAETGYREAKLNNLRNYQKKLEARIKKGDVESQPILDDILKQKDIMKAGLKESSAQKEIFEKKWEEIVKPLAAKKPGTRIFLAAEDTADFKHYPWLKGMLSEEELVAVARIKGVNQEMAARMVQGGHKVITERPYMHHAAHPTVDLGAVKKYLARIAPDDADAANLSKFHSRSQKSLPMVPDVGYAMERYLPDANRRIQVSGFWKRGQKDGWHEHSKQASQMSPALKDFWSTINDSFSPHEYTSLDKWAQKYQGIEVARLLAGSASVPFKHGLKVLANLASLDVGTFARVLPKSTIAVMKNALRPILQKQGFKPSTTIEDELIAAYTRQGSMYRNIIDFDLEHQVGSKFDRMLNEFNRVGGYPTALVEKWDRAHTFLASMDMAAKKGMTAEQALYGVFDTIVKDNFLGGPMSPAWLRNPKVRAMFLFQGTPYKIMERRTMLAWRSGKAINKAGEETMDLLKNIRQYVKEGEVEMKLGMIKHALGSEKDIFGTPVVKQFMKELLIAGTVISAGKAALDVDLTHHVFHPPLLSSAGSDLKLASNPLVSAGLSAKDKKEDDSDFFFQRMAQSWLKSGGFQAQVTRAMRLGKGDIPERYQDARYPELSYIFAVPSKEYGH